MASALEDCLRDHHIQEQAVLRRPRIDSGRLAAGAQVEGRLVEDRLAQEVLRDELARDGEPGRIGLRANAALRAGLDLAAVLRRRLRGAEAVLAHGCEVTLAMSVDMGRFWPSNARGAA